MKNFLAVLSFISVALFGCKKTFDEPPLVVEPNITVTTTIAQLKAMHTSGQYEAITNDLVISGVVNADDRSGNYYKQISIQDSTAGITVRLDGTNLYTQYPVGRRIYIKLKGLYLSDYNGLVQLVATNTGAGLASSLFDQHILKGSWNNTLTPRVVTVATLNNTYQSMLIQLNNTEVIPADTNKTWADAATQTSANINVKECGGTNIVVRTSGYANFAGVPVPKGNGKLTAIYTVFGNTKQLIIRDTSDAKLTGPRCGQGPVTNYTLMNISDLRAMTTGTIVPGPAQKAITGIVISDKSTNNLNARNIVLQQSNTGSGIVVRFDQNHTFNLGDSILINLNTTDSISDFNGLRQVAALLSNARLIASGKSITPRVATIAQINANFETWESTLVKVTGVTLTPAGTYSGNATMTQGADNIILYTATGATFASQTKPTTAVDVTAYLTQGGATAIKELSIRNLSDVSTGGTGGGGTPTTLLEETFESQTANTDISISGWNNIAEVGGVKYQAKSFSNNKYAQITAFSSSNPAATVKSWLITKAFNLNGTTNEVLTFETKDGYVSGNTTLKVYYSTNYSGSGAPSAATWTLLPATVATGGPANAYATNFTPSGNVSLNAISGSSVYIAFVYEGGNSSSPASTTTYQIDNVKIVGN